MDDPSGEEQLSQLQAPDGTAENIGAEENTALVIKISSWATPVVGLTMLVVGLLGGYFLRPLFETQSRSASLSPTSVPVPPNQPTPDADLVQRQQAMMEAFVSQTRHFRGDPDAPVTLIEFSDFQ